MRDLITFGPTHTTACLLIYSMNYYFYDSCIDLLLGGSYLAVFYPVLKHITRKTTYLFICIADFLRRKLRRSSLSEESFSCTTCLKSYRYKNGLYRHLKFECGKEPQFHCPNCPYKTKHKSSLKTHVISRHLDINASIWVKVLHDFNSHLISSRSYKVY